MTKYLAPKLNSQLTALRRQLHARPELSGNEEETAAKIFRQLEALQPESIVTGLGGYGLSAIFEGEQEGPTVMFRAELDGLPIHETNGFKHRSVYEGRGHKCGHDGHMTILVGLGKLLAQRRPARGRVVLLFQPAEETGEGAERVLNSPAFESLTPDYIFALHNLPGFPAGQIVLRQGPFSAAVKSLIVKLHGKTAHAGEPEQGVNPAAAIAEILNLAGELTEPDRNSPDFAIVTPVHVTMGEKAYGVSAGYGEVHFTIRTWRQKDMAELSRNLISRIKTRAKAHGLRCQTQWLQVFRTTRNDKKASAILESAVRRQGMDYLTPEFPFRWGEDFGLFTQRFRGALFGLGAGEKHPALHNPDYDFPDGLIGKGVRIFRAIADEILDAPEKKHDKG